MPVPLHPWLEVAGQAGRNGIERTDTASLCLYGKPGLEAPWNWEDAGPAGSDSGSSLALAIAATSWERQEQQQWWL